MIAHDAAPAEPDFIRWQRALADCVRAPDAAGTVPGVPAARLAVYRELVFDNLQGLLRGSFPVCAAMLGEAGWTQLLRDFLRVHRAGTPLFHELPREWLDFLATRPGLPDWLPDLAHYEWAELALTLAPDPQWPDVDATGDPLHGVPVISPLAWLCTYRYPVHRLRAGENVPPTEVTRLLLYRDAGGDVRFLLAQAATARLLELLCSGSALTGAAAILRLLDDLPAGHGETLRAHALALLRELTERRIVCGVRYGPLQAGP